MDNWIPTSPHVEAPEKGVSCNLFKRANYYLYILNHMSHTSLLSHSYSGIKISKLIINEIPFISLHIWRNPAPRQRGQKDKI